MQFQNYFIHGLFDKPDIFFRAFDSNDMFFFGDGYRDVSLARLGQAIVNIHHLYIKIFCLEVFEKRIHNEVRDFIRVKIPGNRFHVVAF